jgi:hypothetical protein
MVLYKLTIPKQVSDLSYSNGKLVVCLHMSDRLNPSPPPQKKTRPSAPLPHALADMSLPYLLRIFYFTNI